MRRRGVSRAFVNTQVGNDAALNLYRRCGFRELTVGLRILARPL
jgi:ribosomal protein S18 acetylase RimI-like enzyme